jgi:hypothetical protein
MHTCPHTNKHTHTQLGRRTAARVYTQGKDIQQQGLDSGTLTTLERPHLNFASNTERAWATTLSFVAFPRAIRLHCSSMAARTCTTPLEGNANPRCTWLTCRPEHGKQRKNHGSAHRPPLQQNMLIWSIVNKIHSHSHQQLVQLKKIKPRPTKINYSTPCRVPNLGQDKLSIDAVVTSDEQQTKLSGHESSTRANRHLALNGSTERLGGNNP